MSDAAATRRALEATVHAHRCPVCFMSWTCQNCEDRGYYKDCEECQKTAI